ncbi:MAG: transporter substrate-binding domain-containing protein, partial [Pseudomonas sp.]|nr:transporter substrate-binding domain-containing protein [Pseudomonas sp.]
LATAPTPTLATLGNYRLAWVRGYKYEEYLPTVRRFNQIERRSGILPMLQHGRADFYIDALTEAKYVLSQAQDPALFKLTHIAELPLYVGFADTERGRALMAVYDQRLGILVQTGELKAIFERWKQPYPF